MRICDYQHMTRDEGRLADAAELFRALASPVRVGVLLELTEGERCVHDLVDALGVAQPLVSQHLRILRAADLVVGQPPRAARSSTPCATSTSPTSSATPSSTSASRQRLDGAIA